MGFVAAVLVLVFCPSICYSCPSFFPLLPLLDCMRGSQISRSGWPSITVLDAFGLVLGPSLPCPLYQIFGFCPIKFHLLIGVTILPRVGEVYQLIRSWRSLNLGVFENPSPAWQPWREILHSQGTSHCEAGLIDQVWHMMSFESNTIATQSI
ncbi:hypothetical protein BDV30DRAFT_75814 [Aspergillus minisclerotigenes]|uniref:Uncharacterized protein n=1 Tax=Aspergillus minisclerotigenes TaxID=656917 RepID=A0A5N6J8P8_9EURO|nr:hypothetical protein BDV30DRAFT_75814 [Aspergillus minisclerotigenes]